MGVFSDSNKAGLWVGVVPVCLTLGLRAEAARDQPEAHMIFASAHAP